MQIARCRSTALNQALSGMRVGEERGIVNLAMLTRHLQPSSAKDGIVMSFQVRRQICLAWNLMIPRFNVRFSSKLKVSKPRKGNH